MMATIDVDDDVLLTVTELADRRGVSVGKMLSVLALRALNRMGIRSGGRNGVPILEARPDEGLVTAEVVARLLYDN